MAALWAWEKQKMSLKDCTRYILTLDGQAKDPSGAKIAGELPSKNADDKTLFRFVGTALQRYTDGNPDQPADAGVKILVAMAADQARAILGNVTSKPGKPQSAALNGVLLTANAVLGGGTIEAKPAAGKGK